MNIENLTPNDIKEYAKIVGTMAQKKNFDDGIEMANKLWKYAERLETKTVPLWH